MIKRAQPRVAVIYDDQARPETTGVYCWRALAQLAEVTHLLPYQLGDFDRDRFDVHLFVDDGFSYPIPEGLPCSAYWAIDTHLDLSLACERNEWNLCSPRSVTAPSN